MTVTQNKGVIKPVNEATKSDKLDFLLNIAKNTDLDSKLKMDKLIKAMEEQSRHSANMENLLQRMVQLEEERAMAITRLERKISDLDSKLSTINDKLGSIDRKTQIH